MVLWDDWKPFMRRYREPHGPFITRGAANYPTEMNKLLANQLVRAAVACRVHRTQANAMVKTGRWANTLVAGHLLPTNATLQTSHSAMHGTLQHTTSGSDAHKPTMASRTVNLDSGTGLPPVHMSMPLRGVKRPPHLTLSAMAMLL